MTIRNVFFWVRLWQLKEYRADRLFTHLKDTNEGHKTIFSMTSVFLVALIILYITSAFSDALSYFFPIVTCGIFALIAIGIIKELFGRKLRRPIFTVKAIGLVLFSILFTLFVTAFPLTDPFLWLVLVAAVLPVFVATVVALLAFPTEVYTDFYIQKAKVKRQKLRNLHVIAVSGSYGKSSTKEIIAHVLSTKYSVVKTPLSNNTPLAIAKTILQKVDEATDIFVVELGAYKRGEIKQLADMVLPTISVTTAVSDQHLALYGSMQDVVASELELFRSMPKHALILLNKNSKGTEALFEKLNGRNVVWYEVANRPRSHVASAFHVEGGLTGTSWTYKKDSDEFTLQSPLLGSHTAENILPAVYLGLLFDLPIEKIQKAIRTLSPMPKTMEKVRLANGLTVIDDTFNASPESVQAAIAHLQFATKRKILVMSPLIELGKNAKERHRQIGRLLASIDIVYLTNKNSLKEIQQGILEKRGITEVYVNSYANIAKALKMSLHKGDLVIFEGKEAGVVLKALQ